VALLSIPVLLRRVLVVSGALIGAFVGFVLVLAVFLPFGGAAERLGANIAAGLIGGCVVGALVGFVVVLVRKSRPPLDASVPVVGVALAGGLVGAIIGAFGPSVVVGEAPDLSVFVLLTVSAGGGAGWCAGASLGWRMTRTAPNPNRFQRCVVLVAAVGIALFGVAIVATVYLRQFGPSIDELSKREVARLPLIASIYMLDTVIAVATLAMVAVRNTGERLPPTGARVESAEPLASPV
jgi:hypothetical protein